ncbi:MAG: hypothetical protein ACT4NV_13620 [Rhodoferax sp.]
MTLAHYDARSFFEKALAHGLEHGILNEERLRAMDAEAPKGIVQIARYFGTEYLRPELERALQRLVALVSLSLEVHSEGDLRQAAVLLREHSLLSRSKAGADMLKALIVMPQSSHFAFHEGSVFADRHIPLLERWTLRSAADYRAELDKRRSFAQHIACARCLGEALGLDDEDLQSSGHDADAVVRTALLALGARRKEYPDWRMFEKLAAFWIKQLDAPAGHVLKIPALLPADLQAVAQPLLDSVLADLRWARDSGQPLRRVFQQTSAFMGRYYWIEDGMAAVVDYDRAVSKEWARKVGDAQEESAVLTALVCMAVGSPPKPVLTEKAAAALVRKLRKSGWQPAQVSDFVRAHAPVAHRDDYLALWTQFVQEHEATLRSDMVYASTDALAVLRRECNIQAA